MAEEKKPYIIDGQRVTLEEYRKTKFEDLVKIMINADFEKVLKRGY